MPLWPPCALYLRYGCSLFVKLLYFLIKIEDYNYINLSNISSEKFTLMSLIGVCIYFLF